MAVKERSHSLPNDGQGSLFAFIPTFRWLFVTHSAVAPSQTIEIMAEAIQIGVAGGDSMTVGAFHGCCSRGCRSLARI